MVRDSSLIVAQFQWLAKCLGYGWTGWLGKEGVVRYIPFLNWESDIGLWLWFEPGALPKKAYQTRLESKGDLISGGVKGFFVVRPQGCAEI
jgi:hypothetical protein